MHKKIKEIEEMKMLANSLKKNGKTIQYVGQMNMLNQPHGKGVMTSDDGRIYDGQYRYGEREGRGIYTWDDGRKYDGEWKNNKKEGHGLLYDKDEKLLYEGQWVDSKKADESTISN